MKKGRKPMPMYCPNCGHLNYGNMNNEGEIRYSCKYCRRVMIRIPKGRRLDFIKFYADEEEL